MAIKAFLGCKTCQGMPPALDVGLADPTTMEIHCRNCDQPVGSFPLATHIPLRCDACDEEITPDHKH